MLFREHFNFYASVKFFWQIFRKEKNSDCDFMSRFNPKTILSKDPKDLSSKTKRRKDATLAMLAPDIVDTDPQVRKTQDRMIIDFWL